MQENTSSVNVCGSDCEMETTPHGVSMPLQSSGTSAASFPKASIPSRCDFLPPETLKTSQIRSVIYTFPLDWESLESETFSGGTSVKCTFSVHAACLIHMYMLLPCPLITSFFGLLDFVSLKEIKFIELLKLSGAGCDILVLLSI